MVPEPPDGVCGFVLRPEDIGYEAVYNDDEEWYRSQEVCCCWRETWSSYERCIWHADVENKPSDELANARGDLPEHLDGAKLQSINLLDAIEIEDEDPEAGSIKLKESLSEDSIEFNSCSLIGADFKGSHLGFVDFAGANLQEANLSKSTLTRTFFNDANLNRAEFLNANLQFAILAGAKLYHADFTDADLRSANFVGADVRNVRLINADVNRATSFGRLSDCEKAASTPSEWDEISRTYHTIKSRFSDHGLAGKARRYHVLERLARGKEAKESGGLTGYSAYLNSLLSWILTGFGVKVTNLTVVILVLFTLSTSWYFCAGVDNSVYYSVITFTTSPPHPPTGNTSRIVAMIETYFGTLLIVLLGYVLGNRERF